MHLLLFAAANVSEANAVRAIAHVRGERVYLQQKLKTWEGKSAKEKEREDSALGAEIHKLIERADFAIRPQVKGAQDERRTDYNIEDDTRHGITFISTRRHSRTRLMSGIHLRAAASNSSQCLANWKTSEEGKEEGTAAVSRP